MAPDLKAQEGRTVQSFSGSCDSGLCSRPHTLERSDNPSLSVCMGTELSLHLKYEL